MNHEDTEWVATFYQRNARQCRPTHAGFNDLLLRKHLGYVNVLFVRQGVPWPISTALAPEVISNGGVMGRETDELRLGEAK